MGYRTILGENGAVALRLDGITTELPMPTEQKSLTEFDVTSCFLQAVLDANRQINLAGDTVVPVRSGKYPHGPRWHHGEAEIAFFPTARMHWSIIPIVLGSIYSRFVREKNWHEMKFRILDDSLMIVGDGNLSRYSGLRTSPQTATTTPANSPEIVTDSTTTSKRNFIGRPKDPMTVPLPHLHSMTLEFSSFAHAPSLPTLQTIKTLFKASIAITRAITGGATSRFNPPVRTDLDWNEYPVFLTFYPEPDHRMLYGEVAEVIAAIAEFGEKYGYFALEYTAIHGTYGAEAQGLMKSMK
ncbi:MAG: hypothetical protein Q9190_006258 [Brigantiaea leucoxantha]